MVVGREILASEVQMVNEESGMDVMEVGKAMDVKALSKRKE